VSLAFSYEEESSYIAHKFKKKSATQKTGKAEGPDIAQLVAHVVVQILMLPQSVYVE
jgi:hypothetical protein